MIGAPPRYRYNHMYVSTLRPCGSLNPARGSVLFLQERNRVAWCLYLLAHAHALFKAGVNGSSDNAAAWRGHLDWHQSFQNPSGPTPSHGPGAQLVGQVVGAWT